MIKYLRIVSDLHTEMRAFNFALPELETDCETVLVLAGDIGVGIQGLEFIKPLGKRFPHIIYVAGNHEFYHNDITLVKKNIEIILKLEGINNIYVVDRAATLELEGHKFVCGTLWTDFNKNNPLAHIRVRNGLNDYRVINKNGAALSTYDTHEIFKDTFEYFKNNVDDNTIVITHHMPSLQAVSEEYREEGLINHGFASDLDNFIIDRKPKYWFFGHGHNSNDFVIGETRLISNPRGYIHYGDTENSLFNPELLIEIDNK
jgi:hypothetical protein